MSLRLYALAIALTWGTALSGLILINHGIVLIALLILLPYWCIVLAIGFKLESIGALRPFRFVGSHDKRDEYEDCQ